MRTRGSAVKYLLRLLFALHCLILSYLIKINEAYAQCERVISTAPSITDTLKLLELSSHIVGVTRFCNKNSLTQNPAIIGGFQDLNYERIVKLDPSIVFLLNESFRDGITLKKLGQNEVVVKQQTLIQIIDSISQIAEICNVKEKGEQIVRDMQAQLQDAHNRSLNKSPLSVMFIVGLPDRSEFSTMYVSGQDSVYFELSRKLNAEVVGHKLTTPLLSYPMEAIIKDPPDLVIHINPESKNYLTLEHELRENWQKLLPNLRDRQIVTLSDPSAWSGGPAFLQLNQKLEEIFNNFR